jgi:hypothetical protein
MKLTPQFIRSVRGQLSLLATTYLGAVCLALAAWTCRSILFESYIREKFPEKPMPGSVAAAVDQVALGVSEPKSLPPVIDELATKEADRRRPAGATRPAASDIEVARDALWTAVYGAWIDRDNFDPADRVASAFLSEPSCLIFERLRRTLVVGNERQRSRALHLLSLAASDESRSQARALCEYAKERSRRRHEHALVEQAEQVLNVLGPER